LWEDFLAGIAPRPDAGMDSGFKSLIALLSTSSPG
jgi:hypothetical protein